LSHESYVAASILFFKNMVKQNPTTILPLYIYDPGNLNVLNDLPHTYWTLQNVKINNSPVEIKIQSVDDIYNYVCNKDNIYWSIRQNPNGQYDFTEMFKLLANTNDATQKTKVQSIISLSSGYIPQS
jgi:hypothetical protein